MFHPYEPIKGKSIEYFSVLEHGFCKSSSISKVPITIETFDWLVVNNPAKDEIQKLWPLHKAIDEKEYTKIKSPLPCIKPHGLFYADFYKDKARINLKDNGYNGIMYFEIDYDKLYKNSTEETKALILELYQNIIYRMGTTVGGKGVWFWIKTIIPKVTANNFLKIQQYFIDEVFTGLTIDEGAKGLAKNQVIPYDENYYLNNDVSVASYPIELLKDEEHIKEIDCIVGEIKEGGRCISPTIQQKVIICFFTYKVLMDTLTLQTKFNFPDNETKFINQEIDYLKVYTPRLIYTGKRHKAFKIMINNLMALNPGITLLAVQSYINFWNFQMTDVPLEFYDMLTTVNKEYQRLREGGENISWKKKKTTHTNPDYPWDKMNNERFKVAHEQIGMVKMGKSNDKVIAAIKKVWYAGIEMSVLKNLVIKFLSFQENEKDRVSKGTIFKHYDLALSIFQKENISVSSELKKPTYVTDTTQIKKNNTMKTKRITAADKAKGMQELPYYVYHFGEELGTEMYEGQFSQLNNSMTEETPQEAPVAPTFKSLFDMTPAELAFNPNTENGIVDIGIIYTDEAVYNKRPIYKLRAV